mmetsp:Transcript_19288/g.32869  ORF Transcript_19288/g.32869 Transcript_19288/m.32869 type:complete len:93 (+) Transcript_19288:158-436(+)
MLCPDSRDAHYVWKDLLKEASPVEGKTYGDLVNMKVTPFVLPYNLHSFAVTRVVPYLTDLCQTENKCLQEEYAELCWKNLDWISKAEDLSQI